MSVEDKIGEWCGDNGDDNVEVQGHCCVKVKAKISNMFLWGIKVKPDVIR